MNIAFAGTPEFAQIALQYLLAAGHNVSLVLTQPDRPAGRGLKLQASPVKICAVAHAIPVVQPRSLRLDGKFADDALAAQAALLAARPEVMVVAAYGLILPTWALDLPHLGCLNIHASLLPRWRGAAPIHRAIEAGDACSGITIMQMDAGLDTGSMLLLEQVAIAPVDTTASLHDKLAPLGGQLIVQALELIASNGLTPASQPLDGVTYAQKIQKTEAAIDWHLSAEVIERRLRAFDPFPGATGLLGDSSGGGEIIKCWRGTVVSEQYGQPGEVLSANETGITVACGHAAVCLTELQRPGGKRLTAGQFLQGRAVSAGMFFA
jgi:methionyl-tRNA formyltransferase